MFSYQLRPVLLCHQQLGLSLARRPAWAVEHRLSHRRKVRSLEKTMARKEQSGAARHALVRTVVRRLYCLTISERPWACFCASSYGTSPATSSEWDASRAVVKPTPDPHEPATERKDVYISAQAADCGWKPAVLIPLLL